MRGDVAAARYSPATSLGEHGAAPAGEDTDRRPVLELVRRVQLEPPSVVILVPGAEFRVVGKYVDLGDDVLVPFPLGHFTLHDELPSAAHATPYRLSWWNASCPAGRVQV